MKLKPGKNRLFQRTFCFMMLVMIFLAVPGAAGAADIGAILPKVPAEWTYMVYMNGDNNLEKSVVTDIENEYAAYGSNRDINVVILADRSPGYDDREGDWTSTKLFYVQKDIRATAENALSDWGERDMGDPENLAEFITYCKTNFPLKNTLWYCGTMAGPGTPGGLCVMKPAKKIPWIRKKSLRQWRRQAP
jgi:hypothetical protein